MLLTIFLAVGFNQATTSRPLMLKKTLLFCELKEPLGGNKME